MSNCVTEASTPLETARSPMGSGWEVWKFPHSWFVLGGDGEHICNLSPSLNQPNAIMSESNTIIPLSPLKFEDVYSSDEAVQKTIAIVRAEAMKGYDPDLTTEKGRKAIASLARKVASTKVGLDELRLSAVRDIKEQLKVFDRRGSTLAAAIQTLQNEVRAPLTKYEREQEEILNTIRSFATSTANCSGLDSTNHLKLDLDALIDMDPDKNPEYYKEHLSAAREAYRQAFSRLEGLIAMAYMREDTERKAQEAKKAQEEELAKLRAEAKRLADENARLKDAAGWSAPVVPSTQAPAPTPTFVPQDRFMQWWAKTGSALRPFAGEDAEEFAYRVAQAAWKEATSVNVIPGKG